MTEASVPIVMAIDTNVLVYAEGEGDAVRCLAAQRLLGRVQPTAVVLPLQVLGELHRVLTGRYRRNGGVVREAILGWTDTFRVAESTVPALQAALDLHADHQLPVWDALILAVAAEQSCRLLLSEDYQAGFVWHGVTVVNPFEARAHPLLRQALKQ